MAEKGRKTERLRGFAAVLAAGSILFAGLFGVTSLSARAADLDSGAFPADMTEADKAQLFEELYGAGAADDSAEPSAESGDGASLLGEHPVSEELIGERLEEMTDEEAEEAIREMIPDEETLERLAQEKGSRVMTLAPFRGGYDAGRGLYRYTLTDGGRISLSVPLGAWSEHAVALLPEGGARITALYRDGETVAETPGADGAWLFRETGRYTFLASGEESGRYLVGGFRIVSVQAPVGDSFLWSPEGYRLTGATVNGTALSIGDGRWLSLEKDGRYDLTYAATGGGVGLPEEYRVMFLRDTTPPAIAWEGALHNGRFAGEVHYTVDDPEAEVMIYYNGQPAYTDTQTLAAAGTYFVTATDKSGNMRVWQFIVERRGEIPWKLVGIAAGIAAGVGGLLVLTSRRGMRVR